MNDRVDHVMALMRVPGPSGCEAAISETLRRELMAMGVPEACIVVDGAAEQSAIGGETGNLIVRLDGHGRGERRMLSAHMDTVREAVGCEPRRQGDAVVNAAPGRALGADDRAGCLCLLEAARALLATGGDHAPCTLVFFVQEEIGLVGSRGLDITLLGDPLPALAFNFDGSQPRELVRAVVGVERMTIKVEGVSAHASRPREGLSAALIAARALARLDDAGWNAAIQQRGSRGTANLGVVQGGTGSNVIMGSWSGLMEARAFEIEFRDCILEAWRQAFRDAVAEANDRADTLTQTAVVRFEPGPSYAPYRLSDNAPVVQAALTGMAACGLEPVLTEHWGGMDSSNIVAKGIPAVGFGVGGRHPHSVQETLCVPDFEKACALAVHLALARNA